jgi:hypothetical protein
MKKILVGSFAFFSLFSCQKSSDTPSEKSDSTSVQIDTVASTSTENLSTPSPKNPWFDGIATLISAQADTNYTALRNDSTWKSYATKMDSTWKVVSQKRLNLMRDWAKAEYGSVAQLSDTLFYPFSGPDFLNAYTLFPNTKTYILIALEPIGMLPDFSPKQKEKWGAYFKNMQLSLQDVYKKSYFITKRMNEHLGGQHVYGTLPLMAVFLKQTDHIISDIKAIRLDSLGNLIEMPYDSLSRKAKRPRGVKIEFYKKGDNTLRQLYYFSADLGDGALTDRFRFRKYMDRMGSFNAYAKSASYLMHYEEFAVARNQILNKAKLLLQDDTGIAYHYVDTDKFDVKLYGRYVPPVKDFSKYLYQKDLEKRYKEDSLNVKELPFELGYHWGSKKNNLMLLIKEVETQMFLFRN